MSKITMDGEYAYRCAPTERVRILCTDRPVGSPVVSMRANGDFSSHFDDGRHAFRNENLDLIPLQRPRAKVRGWKNVYSDGNGIWLYPTRAKADAAASSDRIACVWMEECDPPEGQA